MCLDDLNTVGELIEALMQFDLDTPVRTYNSGYECENLGSIWVEYDDETGFLIVD